ncbi:LysM peptidoglycan-binding domain-containing protein [Paenibacillus hamazuiensis]|uniref:LysM peptidoglycan-binding domain-containing protein n=1 Tax=Paenibacillus hamazuiensis TaxID=2936508 RepID=UPI00200FA8CD|nr:LysM peptidoglycan-binding domain-containing protein [Paenibacillus hamazuiensis]
MFIYTVRSGESLYSIAHKYRVSLEAVQSVNQLPAGTLVPGQDLIIPTNHYIVQPGDSLYLIARMSYLSIQTIMTANGLNSYALTVGQRIYLPPRSKAIADNLSFIVPTEPSEVEALIRTYQSVSTYIAVFDYHISAEGELSQLDDTFVIRTLRSHRIVPLATVTNLTAAGFSAELASTVLNDAARRSRLVERIYRLMTNKHYGGVMIDFERVKGEDRETFTEFLRLLARRLKEGGYVTAVAVPPKTREDIPWMLGYDYRGIGAAVDLVFIMAYDWHEISTPPGPVAPIGAVRQTLGFAIERMDRRKILLGLPRYGYDWAAPFTNPANNRAVSVQTAIQLAFRHRVPISYSVRDEQAYFSYRNGQGRLHQVWFENIRGRAAKLDLAVRLRIRGGGSWQLGLEFPQSSYLVNAFVQARKLI